ncbi:hypothetical protein [Coraliomargarita akajimensis]|uniref:Uncharacterized protein n=1 Tax=Coraliomargarita akajimensis (strain DSM 45221 / IAM 15411 / JCM 23193 / KCTC 12865 / 04OKA010-24) TaxID=583355 RepID=D5EME0_CORAD|nr:hypothetical protein [Coraliomargarita akajimensis]ADE53346.1 hypothetical protein Caka_0321 [Coraliomargarita akajimensis DSM 45221]
MRKLLLILLLPLSLSAEAPFGDLIQRLIVVDEKKSENVVIWILWALEHPKDPFVAIKNEKKIEFLTYLSMTPYEELEKVEVIDPFSANNKMIQTGWTSYIVANRDRLDQVEVHLDEKKSTSLSALLESYPITTE